MRRLRYLVPAIAGVLVLVVASALSQAHVKNIDDNWYFDGSLYDDDEISDDARKDPINLIFKGGGGDITLDRVKQHLLDDWDANGDMDNDLVCRSSLHAFWRYFPGLAHDKQDFQLIATNVGCRRQFHIRVWDDLEHDRGTVHTRGEWAVAGIHHERIAWKWPCCTTHKPDRDWDSVRLQALKAMNEHCSQRRWDWHPGATRTYQGYHNSGYIGRLSLRHVASGCDGA